MRNSPVPPSSLSSLAALSQDTCANTVAQIWTLSLAELLTDEQRRALESLLDATMLARCHRFRFVSDQDTFLQAHALLRLLLSHCTGILPYKLSFITNAHGRPELTPGTSAPGLRFNLSHTTGHVAVVLTPLVDCGVDIEWHGRTNDLDAIGRRFFAPPEVASLAALPLAERRTRFYELWTLKEAYIKSHGKGLAIPLSRFSVEIAALGACDTHSVSAANLCHEIQILDSAHPEAARDRWQCLLRTPSPRHTLACVLDTHEVAGKRFKIDEHRAAPVWEYL